jgi:eukaryotic-like serine/threonine-protein kinase
MTAAGGLAAGTLVAGRYRVEAPLGAGGMGAVYRAVDVQGGRPVAVKTVLAELAGEAALERRLEREAAASTFVRHPNVVEVLALDRLAGGGLALVMELVEGRTLRAALGDGALAPRRALVIARQMLLGLGLAHASGVVHRDLKPENVMLATAGATGATYEIVKLLDFGLVKLIGLAAEVLGADRLTRTGIVQGTPAYMAPEQALGRAVDGRADLYAVGCMLFEMLIGAPPFDDADPVAIMKKQVKEPAPALPAAPWATPAVAHVVTTALAKAPAGRFADASAMLAAIEAAFRSIDHVP